MRVLQNYKWDENLQYGVVMIDLDGTGSVEHFLQLTPIKTPLDAVMLMREKFLRKLDIECQLLLGLDENNKPVEGKLLTYGSKYGCIVFDRTPMAQYMVTSKCKKFIFIHNHLSGNVTPSQDDMQCVKLLCELGYLINKQIEDSIIVSVEKNRYYSMRNQNVFEQIDHETFLYLKQLQENAYKGREKLWDSPCECEMNSELMIDMTPEEAKALESIMQKMEKKKLTEMETEKDREVEVLKTEEEEKGQISQNVNENMVDFQEYNLKRKNR